MNSCKSTSGTEKEAAPEMSEDALYSRFNARGRKGFKPTSREQLAEKFPDYGKVGLPAHKAAIEGNVEAMKEISAELRPELCRYHRVKCAKWSA